MLEVFPFEGGILLMNDVGAWILGPGGVTDEQGLVTVMAHTAPRDPHMFTFRVTGMTGTLAQPRVLGTAVDDAGSPEFRDFVKRGGRWVAVATTRRAPFLFAEPMDVRLSSGAPVEKGTATDCPTSGHSHARISVSKAPDGAVLALGTACGLTADETSPLVVERWRPGSKTAEIVALPGVHAGAEVGFVIDAVSADHAWIIVTKPAAGSPVVEYLGRLDGGSIQDVTPRNGQRRIHFIEDKQSAVARGDDVIYVLRPGSATWSPISGIASGDVEFFYTTPNGVVLAGTKTGIFVLERGSTAWEERVVPRGFDGKPLNLSNFTWIATFPGGEMVIRVRTGTHEWYLMTGASKPTLLEVAPPAPAARRPDGAPP